MKTESRKPDASGGGASAATAEARRLPRAVLARLSRGFAAVAGRTVLRSLRVPDATPAMSVGPDAAARGHARPLRALASRIGERCGLALAISALAPPRGGICRATLRHYATTLTLLCLLPAALAYHWSGLLLDELLFPRYRRIPVRAPLFILGVPRSGTTALHHLLARDPRLTTMRTWECLLAPAISWRYLWRGLARLDAGLGRPLGRLLAGVGGGGLQRLAPAHPLALDSPEEDYLALLPRLSCFLLVVAFPDAPQLWRLGRGDRGLDAAARRRLMAAYRRSIQRHLHFHGAGRRYLAKNAAFAPLAGSLLEAFPDARIIACLREPAGAVSSQLASLEPGLRALHGDYRRTPLRARMLEQLGLGYRTLLRVLPGLPAGQAVFLPLAAQRHGLARAVRDCYRCLGLPLAPALAAAAAAGDPGARRYRSGHRHRLADFGLESAAVHRRFADIEACFDFTRRTPLPAHALACGALQLQRLHHDRDPTAPAAAPGHRLRCGAGA